MKKILVLAALLLVGCGRWQPLDAEKLAKDKQAYVVLSAENNAIFMTYPLYDALYIKKSEGELIALDNLSSKPSGHVIPAGKHNIVAICLHREIRHEYAIDSIKISVLDINGGIEVEPGDVVYLGHIDTNITKTEVETKKLPFLAYKSSTSLYSLNYALLKDRFDELDAESIERATGKKITKKLLLWDVPMQNAAVYIGREYILPSAPANYHYSDDFSSTSHSYGNSSVSPYYGNTSGGNTSKNHSHGHSHKSHSHGDASKNHSHGHSHKSHSQGRSSTSHSHGRKSKSDSDNDASKRKKK
ncbi:MAG: hypothetical protein LBH94_06315 [Deltaproteobacteria bacterium]|jgi:hypothetical protein|nr:hypothetical protein [Deltaproteobacteria bacterium]